MAEAVTFIALAFLQRPDGESRQVCVGCSEVLYEQGMLGLVIDEPIASISGGEYARQVIYRIVEPFTLDECRDAIKGRHKGRAWGS
jgi:hypothetical protein